MRGILFSLTLVIVFSCQRDKVEQEQFNHFKIPKLVNPLDSLDLNKEEVWKAKSLIYSSPAFIGVFDFKDSLIYLDRDSIFPKMYARTINYSDLYPYLDSFSTNGLDLIVDNNKEIVQGNQSYVKSYPAYIINNSKSKKLFIGKDGHGFGIQEAKVDNYLWRPLEMRSPDFCGNGYWGVLLAPQEYLVLLFPKCHGEFETKMRVRISNGESIYVSQPFNGSVDRSQFYLKDTALIDYFKNGDQKSIYHSFYGADPILELEPKEQFRNY